MSDLEDSHFDIVIVGAGAQGLVAAKTYLQLSPNTTLLILDSNKTIGGVWAKENCYPGLRTNNQLGTYEFTDFNILDVCPGKVRKGEHIPGEVLHEYFYKYAETFDLLKRVKFGCKVTTAEHLPGRGGGWKLTVTPANGSHRIAKIDALDTVKKDNESSTTVFTRKLIVASGLTSAPMPVSIPGAAPFTPPLLTFGDFRHHATQILEDPNIKHVAVYGSAKSAYDAVYAFASRKKKVTWIIRASGHGPIYMSPSHIYIGPLKVWLEPLVFTRLHTWMSPCVWGDSDGFGSVRRWLHGTRIGRWIVKQYWKKMGGNIITQTGLKTKGPEIEKLLPKEEAFWYGTNISILNYDTDIHQFLQNGTVKVVRKDIERLEAQKVMLTGCEGVEVDAFICSTGWRWDSGIDFLPKNEDANLGIPSTRYNDDQKQMWQEMDSQADKEILSRFPVLATGPGVREDDRVISEPKNTSIAATAAPENSNLAAEPERQKYEPYTPWRLFRGIAPPANDRRDLVFLGMMLSYQTLLRYEITALWAYAYLNAALSPSPPLALNDNHNQPSLQNNESTEEEEKKLQASVTVTSSGSEAVASKTNSWWLYDTALFSRFVRWRYPMGFGTRFPDFTFDGLPYFDLLIGDLGLRKWRKGGWWKEVFGGAYFSKEYKGLVEEWRGRSGGDAKGTE
ncbi:MAG: hypothetical protein Q9181_004517 [Wetmoreana brouardii]